ncbi:nicotinate-nicotinamide nucleotide adenylyltransferase [Vibrio japonicus]|uniref:nicotinate-nucleotide adenylyltransferase n=1 Tax=Vibrio japonicus TaxID=1824638 RepID=A0ABY5LMJ7_9VIBR|nr:nicotinate-nicotinamide nucleotide adenylyltransferase [Vibrio japonicus]UUM33061.1 nicotinate-nicotinamide nucleotide adenylyltransferase [Vibrio japonicus]
MKKIAVFGSAFNPPTLGHKSVIESLSHFDKVLLLPSIAHAWGKDMLDYDERCALVDAFISDLDVDNVERSTIEEKLYQPGESVTTFAVLQALEAQCEDCELTFVMGPDNLINFSKFYRAEEILKRWAVMACPEKVNVRSTDIRNALQIKADVSHLTTPKVWRMLVDKQYY